MIAVVITPGSVTERGVVRPDWDNVTRTDEEGWRFVPLPADEVLEYGRQGIVAKLRGSGPYDTVLSEHCRMEVEGVAYDVTGSVNRWPSLTGDLAHSEIVLTHVDG